MQLKPRDTKGALTRRACRNGAGTSFRHLFYIHSPQRMQAPALDLSPLFCFAGLPNLTRRVCRLFRSQGGMMQYNT